MVISDVLERQIVSSIYQKVNKGNKDNISRTQFYQRFYEAHPEIQWAFLASMVSRNAGWNMCDLEGKWLPKVLLPHVRNRIFFTYERANWLIFQDAFPQLLLYEHSKKKQKPLFHLLHHFHVSKFMEHEWNVFWKTKNINRLMTALIINEQHVIQKPVIDHPYYEKTVFHSFPYKVQDWFHYSCVLLPTISGELYGFSVYDFSNIKERIELGKKLAWLLFHPDYFHLFKLFAERTIHTGSRYDYERYFHRKTGRNTPMLRTVYPIISHHRNYYEDWYCHAHRVKKWFHSIKPPRKFQITSWYERKQKHLHAGIRVANFVAKIK